MKTDQKCLVVIAVLGLAIGGCGQKQETSTQKTVSENQSSLGASIDQIAQSAKKQTSEMAESVKAQSVQMAESMKAESAKMAESAQTMQANAQATEQDLLAKAKEFLNQKNFDQAIATANQILSQINPNSQGAKDLIAQAKAELQKAATGAVDELKNVVGNLGN